MSLGCNAFITMMQTAELRNLKYPFRSSRPAEEMGIVCRALNASSTRGSKRNTTPGFSSDACV